MENFQNNKFAEAPQRIEEDFAVRQENLSKLRQELIQKKKEAIDRFKNKTLPLLQSVLQQRLEFENTDLEQVKSDYNQAYDILQWPIENCSEKIAALQKELNGLEEAEISFKKAKQELLDGIDKQGGKRSGSADDARPEKFPFDHNNFDYLDK